MMFGEHPLEKQFVLKELCVNCGVVNYLQLDGYYKIAANFFHFKFYSVYLYSVHRFQASYMHIFNNIQTNCLWKELSALSSSCLFHFHQPTCSLFDYFSKKTPRRLLILDKVINIKSWPSGFKRLSCLASEWLSLKDFGFCNQVYVSTKIRSFSSINNLIGEGKSI